MLWSLTYVTVLLLEMARAFVAKEDVGTVVPLHRGEACEQPLVAAQRNTATRRDVARAVGVSEQTVRRWHRQGLPHVRPYGPGGIVRYDLELVEAWLLAREQNARVPRANLDERPSSTFRIRAASFG